MYTFEQYIHTQSRTVDRQTAKNQSPEKDDLDVFWPDGKYKCLISEFREKVFCDGIFIGCVWLEEKDNTYSVLDSQRSYVYRGFATKDYACEFLDIRAFIEGLYPEMLIDFDYIIDAPA